MQPDAGKPRRERRPLSADDVQRLALNYVGRYATTRSRLRTYLSRKIAEHGTADDQRIALDPLIERLAALGYVDDRAFAAARAASLARRGYGQRRVADALRAAGIDEADAADAHAEAAGDALGPALAFARKRRIGPYAAEKADRDGERRALAAMLRAGHDFAIAGRIVRADPGEDIAEGG